MEMNIRKTNKTDNLPISSWEVFEGILGREIVLEG